AYLFDGAYKLVVRARDLMKFRNGSDKAGPPGLSEGLEELVRLANYARDRGIQLITLLIVDFDVSNHADSVQEVTNDLVKRFCAQQGIATIDPTTMLMASREPLRVSTLDVHWSTAANALVAKELAARVAPLIAARH